MPNSFKPLQTNNMSRSLRKIAQKSRMVLKYFAAEVESHFLYMFISSYKIVNIDGRFLKTCQKYCKHVFRGVAKHGPVE